MRMPAFNFRDCSPVTGTPEVSARLIKRVFQKLTGHAGSRVLREAGGECYFYPVFLAAGSCQRGLRAADDRPRPFMYGSDTWRNNTNLRPRI